MLSSRCAFFTPEMKKYGRKWEIYHEIGQSLYDIFIKNNIWFCPTLIDFSRGPLNCAKTKCRIDNTKYVTQSTQTKWIKSFTNGKTHRQQSTVDLFFMMYHNESTSEPLLSTTRKKTFQQPTKAHWNCWHGRQSAKTTLWVEKVSQNQKIELISHTEWCEAWTFLQKHEAVPL